MGLLFNQLNAACMVRRTYWFYLGQTFDDREWAIDRMEALLQIPRFSCVNFLLRSGGLWAIRDFI